jgi:molybdopterin-containing oxidoreductase family membrane subunit
MFEKALQGNKSYWIWIFVLLAITGAGFLAYLRQFTYGLGITGMSSSAGW